jgi:hypothetical protein
MRFLIEQNSGVDFQMKKSLRAIKEQTMALPLPDPYAG